MKRNTRSYKSSEVALGYLLLSPVILLVGFLVLAPVIGTFVSSFYRDITFMPPVKFIGLGNYKRMLADPAFWQSVLFFFSEALCELWYSFRGPYPRLFPLNCGS